MILTIDIGNTTVSLGGLERDPEQGYTVHFCGKIDTVPFEDRTDGPRGHIGSFYLLTANRSISHLYIGSK